MKTWSKLLIAVSVLLAQGFAQEPKRLSINQAPADAARQQTVATGSAHRTAPMVQPKALPPLSPLPSPAASTPASVPAASPPPSSRPPPLPPVAPAPPPVPPTTAPSRRQAAALRIMRLANVRSAGTWLSRTRRSRARFEKRRAAGFISSVRAPDGRWSTVGAKRAGQFAKVRRRSDTYVFAYTATQGSPAAT